jgi:hypothetical protein
MQGLRVDHKQAIIVEATGSKDFLAHTLAIRHKVLSQHPDAHMTVVCAGGGQVVLGELKAWLSCGLSLGRAQLQAWDVKRLNKGVSETSPVYEHLATHPTARRQPVAGPLGAARGPKLVVDL